MKVEVVCAWCNRLIAVRETQAESDDRSIVSHSICPECRDRLLGNLEYAFCRRIRVLLTN
jgi:hypothetical protein